MNKHLFLMHFQILQKNELDMPEETVKFNIERVEKLLIKLSRKQVCKYCNLFTTAIPQIIYAIE